MRLLVATAFARRYSGRSNPLMERASQAAEVISSDPPRLMYYYGLIEWLERSTGQMTRPARISSKNHW
jgi:hypothetical protein